MKNSIFQNVTLAGASLTGGSAVATAVVSLAGATSLSPSVPIIGALAGLVVTFGLLALDHRGKSTPAERKQF